MTDSAQENARAAALRALELDEAGLEEIAGGRSGLIFPKNDGSGTYTLVMIGNGRQAERFDGLTFGEAQTKAYQMGNRYRTMNGPLSDDTWKTLQYALPWASID